jgi:hypothetical protein
MEKVRVPGWGWPEPCAERAAPPVTAAPKNPEEIARRLARRAKVAVVETGAGAFAIVCKDEAGGRWPISGGVPVSDIIAALRRKILGIW